MSAIAKTAKPSRKPESAAETLDQLESFGDRAGNWIAENAMLLLAAAVATLIGAGGYGFAMSYQENARQAASAALADVENAYLRSMGSSPDSVLLEEPANPETARRVREEYVTRYQEIADEFSGTLESQLAALEQGSLQQQLGRPDEAISTWQAALDDSSKDSAIHGLLLERIAGSHEAAGRWAEAGAAHESASNLAGFPVRYVALADAARCYAEAGDVAKALALFDRLEAEAPQQQVAPAIRARMSELRASL